MTQPNSLTIKRFKEAVFDIAWKQSKYYKEEQEKNPKERFKNPPPTFSIVKRATLHIAIFFAAILLYKEFIRYSL